MATHPMKANARLPIEKFAPFSARYGKEKGAFLIRVHISIACWDKF